MGLRQTLGRRLISTGIKIYGKAEVYTAKKSLEVSPPHPTTGSAVVEETRDFVHWTPEQSGNVVIAEPDILTSFRRQPHDEDVPGM